MNLIYICVFHQKSYINLLKLLMTSISVKANYKKETTDILIITSPEFQPLIQEALDGINITLQYYVLDLHTLFEAGCARLNIFKYSDIDKYNKILYLDTDILLNSDVNILFNLELSAEKIYALEEGRIGHVYHGGQFFDFTQYDRNTPAFTSGILLFRNSIAIKSLFDMIQSHIEQYIYKEKNQIPVCLDQPFIIYNAITQNKYDNKILKEYVKNNPYHVSSDKIVYHFPGNPGSYLSKFSKMTDFWQKMHNIIAVSPSNVYDTDKMKYLLESAKMHDFTVEIIGLKQDFSWINRMNWFKDYLGKIPENTNPIICFTDAYDVFYVDSIDVVKNKFLSFGANIVWSVEGWYSHQLASDKKFYDELANNMHNYKYLNAGTFIGYKNSLFELFTDIIDVSLKDHIFIN
jgi:lipopolysaccharide biosynthesis glycosyltransferase